VAIVQIRYNETISFYEYRISPDYPEIWIPLPLDAAYLVGGVPGSVAWGAVIGTLSDQIDLQAALDAKASVAYVDSSVNASKSFARTFLLMGG